MFATQHYANATSTSERKRGREDDNEMENGSMSFGEHRNKRLQCLPLRTSPRPSQQFTPLNSDIDQHTSHSRFSSWSSSSALSSQPMQDTDMDMMDIGSPQQVDVGRSQQVTVNAGSINGRMPTPIQPSFAAQVRGQQCEWAGPGPAVTSLNGIINMGHHQTGFSDDQCVPRTMATEPDWHSIHNNRRLPSPISECDDSNQAMNSPGMVLDSHFQNQLSSQLENSTLSAAPSFEPSPPHEMEHPNAMMDIEPCSPQRSGGMSEDPKTPSPNRRGHIRSRHTINSWTWQPGMKKSLSIGYRADCEKCRLKVPGHFNHIVIS